MNKWFKNEMEISFTPESNLNSDIKQSVCETINNEIYFYSDIERQDILTLNKSLNQLKNDLVIRKINEKSEDNKIFLHINSTGGDVFSGFSAMDNILQINKDIPIYTIIDGCCASAATFLSIVGVKRFINKHSFILIHQIHCSPFWGKYDEFLDQKENFDKFMNMLKDVYLQYTKIDKNILNELLKHDIWFNAEEALKYGLVDEIL
jgi:ATP-dependent Clp endopeptidase proteolytic subunit ClpP